MRSRSSAVGVGRVEVADLGLVVPEQGQAVAAFDAGEAQLQDLAGASAGGDGADPDIAQVAVFEVELV